LIRAFIAVSLAPAVGEEIAKIQSTLKEAQGDIRWTRVESMHLTLKFLGDITHTQVDSILVALRNVLCDQPLLHVQAHGLGAFPNLKRPKVLWAGLSGEGLAGLQEKVESALVALDFPREERGFTPHFTLGRVRSLRGWEQILAVVRKHEQVQFGESVIDHVTLYQSTLRSDGAVYSPLGTVSLQKA
jgi:RNA 2',3'-cyclic 3'-phosphodiesterase